MDAQTYISPDLVMAPGMFGDEDQQDIAQMLLQPEFFMGDFSDEVIYGPVVPLPVDLTDPFNTPPLSGFDGYLAGNIDFDETLLASNLQGFVWPAESYTPDLTMMDGFGIPPPPSTASGSQGLSPVDNMYLPYTPPSGPAYTPPSIAPYPSQLNTPEPAPPSPPQTEPKARSKPSLGPKRELRKVIKPETCPVCDKGHAQLRERDRHIITHHYDVAVRMGLNVERPQCTLCDQSFRRKDHLKRHMERRHGF